MSPSPAVLAARLRRRPPAPRPELTPLRGDAVEVVADDGTRLHVEVDEVDPVRAAAAAPTVVLLHGYGLTADAWHLQRLALRGRHRLVLPEHRGHGRSERGPLGPTGVARLADDLGAVLDAVVPEGPIALVGHSLVGHSMIVMPPRECPTRAA